MTRRLVVFDLVQKIQFPTESLFSEMASQMESHAFQDWTQMKIPEKGSKCWLGDSLLGSR